MVEAPGIEPPIDREIDGNSRSDRECKGCEPQRSGDAKSANAGAPAIPKRNPDGRAPSPRAAFAEALAGHVAALLAAGDTAAAMIGTEALHKLLGAVGEGGVVVDLGQARRERANQK
jgi:hypothetical protein